MSEGIVYIFPFTASADQEIVVSAISSQRDLDADPLVLILDPDGLPLIANDDTGEWWDSYVQFRAPVSGEVRYRDDPCRRQHRGAVEFLSMSRACSLWAMMARASRLTRIAP